MKIKFLFFLSILIVGLFSCQKINKIDLEPSIQLNDPIINNDNSKSNRNWIYNGIDWIDSNNDGLADKWSTDGQSLVGIYSGYPFKGRYQTISNDSNFVLKSPIINAPNDKYKLTFSYKSTNYVNVKIMTSETSGFILLKLEPACMPSKVNIKLTTNVYQIVFCGIPMQGLFEVDDVCMQ